MIFFLTPFTFFFFFFLVSFFFFSSWFTSVDQFLRNKSCLAKIANCVQRITEQRDAISDKSMRVNTKDQI